MARALVLIVEDEPLVRLNAAEMIEDAGYGTLQAASADQALVLLETVPRIRAVFTDINLGCSSMNGIALAVVIHDRWPPVELILTSGHFHSGEAELPPRSHFLAKPYSGRQLGGALDSFDLKAS